MGLGGCGVGEKEADSRYLVESELMGLAGALEIGR